MEALTTWRSRPLFISSTFRDMHAERDYLHNFVFPELAERLRSRRHHLEPIDLRWGVEIVSVDEARAKELLVLKVCLAEIERSRPFLIIILGDRYGWIPPEERMKAAAEEAGFQTELGGKSITALEIEYGVLDSPEQRRRSFFYFREPLPYDQMPSEVASLYSDQGSSSPEAREAHERLEGLKARIMREMPERVRRYNAPWDASKQRISGLEEFGRQVLEDLWKELDDETSAFLEAAPPSWQEQERQALEEFVEQRALDFIGRDEIIAEASALAGSPRGTSMAWGFCITGEPGSGKSALFSQLYRFLKANEKVLLLAHAAGISARSLSVDSLLRRWIGELCRFLSTDRPVLEAQTPEEIQKTFAMFLSQASAHTRVVLLIDALNEFEPTPAARHMTWLPELWPENARFISTAIPGEHSLNLSRRNGITLMPLSPLGPAESENIIRAVCRRYHKTIHPDIIRALSAKTRENAAPSVGNPLWLKMAIEELLLLDADDFSRLGDFTGSAEEQLHALLLDVSQKLPPDVEALYSFVLQRTEDVFGNAWARAFVNLIAVSRKGLRESDLRLLLPQCSDEAWDDLRFASLRRGFRAHLVQRGEMGQWDFFHAQMRNAVRNRNLSEKDSLQNIHRLITRHLENLTSEDPFRIREIMFHFIGGDEKGKAAAHYGSKLSDAELKWATRDLAAFILGGILKKPNPALMWVCDLLTVPDISDTCLRRNCTNMLFDLIDALKGFIDIAGCMHLTEAVKLKLEELRNKVPDNADYARDLSVSYNNLANFAKTQGDAQRALDYYQKAHEIHQELRNKVPDNADYARDLVVSYYKMAGFSEQQQSSEKAVNFWHLCYATLCVMKKAGMYLDPPLANLLKRLEMKEQRSNKLIMPSEEMPESNAEEKESNNTIKRRSTMGKILDAVEKYLTGEDWNFKKLPDNEAILCSVKRKEASFRMVIQSREQSSLLTIKTSMENNIPEGKRLIVSDFINRMNFHVQIGNFELDMNDGEIRFRTSIDIEDSTLTQAMIRNLMAVGVIMMDQAFPIIMGIVYGGVSAKDAEQKFVEK